MLGAFLFLILRQPTTPRSTHTAFRLFETHLAFPLPSVAPLRLPLFIAQSMSSSLKVTRRVALGGKRAESSPAPPSAARPAIAAPTSSVSARNVATSASAAASFDLSPVPAARLEGTRASFPLSANRLITLAQELFATDTGVAEGADALLADDFRFDFPVISLPKERYLAAVRSFQLRSAFPNLDAHPYDWRVDKYEPNRVRFCCDCSFLGFSGFEVSRQK